MRCFIDFDDGAATWSRTECIIARLEKAIGAPRRRALMFASDPLHDDMRVVAGRRIGVRPPKGEG